MDLLSLARRTSYRKREVGGDARVNMERARVARLDPLDHVSPASCFRIAPSTRATCYFCHETTEPGQLTHMPCLPGHVIACCASCHEKVGS